MMDLPIPTHSMSATGLAPLLQLSNQLKTEACRELLVSSQSAALEEIQSVLENRRLAALTGPQNVGKTFLGWVLCNQDDFSYYTWPIESIDDRRIIVDNAPADRVDARATRAQCQLYDVDDCVYITRHRLTRAESVPEVRLQLSSEEEQSIITHWNGLVDIQQEETVSSIQSAREYLNQYPE